MKDVVGRNRDQYKNQVHCQKNNSLLLRLNGLRKRTRTKEERWLAAYNKDRDEAEAAIQCGEYISHEELKQEIKKWQLRTGILHTLQTITYCKDAAS